ncbi:MAG TPA: hypothetical protein VGR81_06600 [Candidatus Acidoferrales bacterium]|nr:hypothetical protein [Candidatus Acidoferrales bacterium]
MNKAIRISDSLLRFLLPVLALAVALPARAQAPQNPKNARGEQFFIISSVNLPKHEIVLMAPTQLTLVAGTTSLSEYVGGKGQKLAEKDLKAGDTVWAIIKAGKNGQFTAVRIREGSMTPADLQKLYLSHPSNVVAPLPSTMQSAAPLTVAPQVNAQNYAHTSNPSALSATPGLIHPDTHHEGLAHPRTHRHGPGDKPRNS